MKILAITACTAGIAHTYIAKEKLENAAKELGDAIKVETQGSIGVENEFTPEEIKESGFDKYYVDHTLALWPQAAGGIPFNACEFQSKGDVITDLMEDMAADATS